MQAQAQGDLHAGRLQLSQPGLHLVLVGDVEDAACGLVLAPVEFHHRDLDAARGFLRGVVRVGAQGADASGAVSAPATAPEMTEMNPKTIATVVNRMVMMRTALRCGVLTALVIAIAAGSPL